MSRYYIEKETTDSKYRLGCWEVATGLQEVDALTPSEYLYELANKHINNKCSLEDVNNELKKYHKDKNDKKQKEADLVSERIVELLSYNSFKFSPSTLMFIHKTLFQDIYEHAGMIRELNITKAEPILNGKTVNYANYQMIKDTLEYDFGVEKAYKYANKNEYEVVSHIAQFTSSIWQVHPFMEGNTRTSAVFMQLYLNNMGFKVNNEPFKENALYFRNALVRANYANFPKGIDVENKYLEMFFENLLFEKNNVLDNESLKID